MCSLFQIMSSLRFVLPYRRFNIRYIFLSQQKSKWYPVVVLSSYYFVSYDLCYERKNLKMFWWVELGYPNAFEMGKGGFPKAGQVIKYYREKTMDHEGKPY